MCLWFQKLLIECFDFFNVDIFLQSYNTYSSWIGESGSLGGIIEVIKFSASINEIIKKTNY